VDDPRTEPSSAVDASAGPGADAPKDALAPTDPRVGRRAVAGFVEYVLLARLPNTGDKLLGGARAHSGGCGH
jgi:hypothetical protein